MIINLKYFTFCAPSSTIGDNSGDINFSGGRSLWYRDYELAKEKINMAIKKGATWVTLPSLKEEE